MALNRQIKYNRDEIAADSKQQHENEWTYWKPLAVTTAFYSILIFLTVIAAFTANSGPPWVLLFSASIIFAQSQLVGIFAALAPGSYFKRLAITQCCLGCVFLSLIGAVFLGSKRNPGPTFANTTIASTAALSVGSQAVFWIFRLARGWRILRKKSERGPAYSIQDLFALTAYLAITFSLIATSTENNFTGDFFGYLIVTISFAVATFVYGVPTLLMTFKLEEIEQGCIAQVVAIAAIAVLISIPFASIGAAEIIGPLLLFLAGSSLFTWIPLATMRQLEFVLCNGRVKMPEEATESGKTEDGQQSHVTDPLV